MKIIPYGRQCIDNQDIKLVSKALREDLITTGNYVEKFENKISNYLNVRYALSCNSGTSAIHLAYMAIGLKKDDVVIMPAINFIAAYNMALLCKAKIFLADVDPYTGQITPETILKCINYHKIKKIKLIITMYLGGYPNNILELYRIKKKFNCYLIEDACHALGAKYYSNKKFFHIGSCKHSDISTFSLHPLKTITSGEGGVITTNNKILYNKIKIFRSHGIVKSKFHWKYDVQNLGFNYRLSDINCALAYGQLNKINKFINYRKKIFHYYNFEIKNLKSVNKIFYNDLNKPSYHLFLISLKFNKRRNKDNFLSFLKKNNIFAQVHYIPIYKHKLFKKKINLLNYRGSEYYCKNTLSLPIFYKLTPQQQKKVIEKVRFYTQKYL
jgi:dTDP-4-amino-4,6-dideoxygalactose transaminase